MKRIAATFSILLATALALAGAGTTWEGTAMMSGYGEFPPTGYYAASDSFPRNTTVTVTNVSNGKTVDVVVTLPLGNPGLFLLLSPEAASALGIGSGTTVRVRATISQAGSVPATTASGSRGSDPDFNPSLLAMKEGATGTTTPATTTGTTTPTTTTGTTTPATTTGSVATDAPPSVDTRPTASPETGSTAAVALPDPSRAPPVTGQPAATSGTTGGTGETGPSTTTVRAPLPTPDTVSFVPPATAAPVAVTGEAAVPEYSTSEVRAPSSLAETVAKLPDPAGKTALVEMPSLVSMVAPEIKAVEESVSLADPEIRHSLAEVAAILEGGRRSGGTMPRLVIALADPGIAPDLLPEAFSGFLSPESVAKAYPLPDSEIRVGSDTPEIASMQRASAIGAPGEIALRDPDARDVELPVAGDPRLKPDRNDAWIALADPDAKSAEVPSIVNGHLPESEMRFVAELPDPETRNPDSAEAGFDMLAADEPSGGSSLADPELKGEETPSMVAREGIDTVETSETALVDPDPKGEEVPELQGQEITSAYTGEPIALMDPERKEEELPNVDARGSPTVATMPDFTLADPSAKATELAEVLNGHLPKREAPTGAVSLLDPSLAVKGPAVVATDTATAATASSPSSTAAVSTGAAETVATMVPSTDRPPAGTGATAVAATVAGSEILAKAGISTVETLQKDRYYVRLGAYTSIESLLAAAAGIKGYALIVQKVVRKGVTYWVLLVGPVARDESGVILLGMKASGFKDAYVTTGG